MNAHHSYRPRTRLAALSCLGLILPLLLLWRATPARAAGIVSICTEQGLLNAINGGSGSISFACGPNPVVITVTQVSGLNALAGTFYTIDGGNLVTLSGGHAHRLFDVRPTAALTLTNIILTDGYQDDIHGNLPNLGGAILAEGRSLTLDHVTVRNSQSTGYGGGIEIITGTVLVKDSLIEGNQSGDGGGIDNDSPLALVSTLTLLNTTVRSNHALTNAGGGLSLGRTVLISGSQIYDNVAPTGGGGIKNHGTLSLTNSTLSSNSASAGGGLINQGNTMVVNTILDGNSAAYGAGAYNYGTISLIATSFSDNSAYSTGGIHNDGGKVTVTYTSFNGNRAILNGGGITNGPAGTVTVTASTLSNNSTADAGGGIANYGALALNNSTLSGNSALFGGGLYNQGRATLVNVTLDNHVGLTSTAHNLYLASGVLSLTNTIVNNAASYGANCFGGGFPKRVSLGHNLANDTSCGLLASGDHEGPFVPILLGGLANHGGPTLTQLPHAASAAIDGGDNAVCAASPINALDQRGASRAALGAGPACDIGAVERQAFDVDNVPWLWLPLIVR